MLSHSWSICELISGTVETRCSNDVNRTFSILFSSARFNVISVTGRLSLPGGEADVCMPRAEKVVGHMTGTFAWCSRGCVWKGKDAGLTEKSEIPQQDPWLVLDTIISLWKLSWLSFISYALGNTKLDRWLGRILNQNQMPS